MKFGQAIWFQPNFIYSSHFILFTHSFHSISFHFIYLFISLQSTHIISFIHSVQLIILPFNLIYSSSFHFIRSSHRASLLNSSIATLKNFTRSLWCLEFPVGTFFSIAQIFLGHRDFAHFRHKTHRWLRAHYFPAAPYQIYINQQ